MNNTNKKPWKLSKSIVGAGVAGVAGAAMIPGTAEAHCGHGMYGFQRYQWDELVHDSGCTGKGAPPSPFCARFYQGDCIDQFNYYNCYWPC
jgi:hypothetical protein